MKPLGQIFILLSFLMFSGFAAGQTSGWFVMPQPAVVTAEHIEIDVPGVNTIAKETEVTVTVDLPGPCYRMDIIVDRPDNFTHVLKPVVSSADYPCILNARSRVQKVNLGYLPVGEHQIIVEQVAQPVEPVAFWVLSDEFWTH